MRIKTVVIIINFILVLSGIIVPCSFSYGDALDVIVANIQHSYDAIKGFKAHFVQESTVKSLNAAQVQKAEGEVCFKKEGKMYWDYQQPTPQKIISDGKTLWFYEPADAQVTVAEVGEGLQSQISADLLNGKANLKRDFEVKLITSESEKKEGRLVLELMPRMPQANFNRVILKLNEKNFELYQTEVYDLFDNLTRITFSRVKINESLPDSLFTFVPPKGTEVLTPPTIPLP
jgi:outer membrane lipoprotein carrier protein